MHTDDENKFRDKLHDEELYELYAFGVVWFVIQPKMFALVQLLFEPANLIHHYIQMEYRSMSNLRALTNKKKHENKQ